MIGHSFRVRNKKLSRKKTCFSRSKMRFLVQDDPADTAQQSRSVKLLMMLHDRQAMCPVLRMCNEMAASLMVIFHPHLLKSSIAATAMRKLRTAWQCCRWQKRMIGDVKVLAARYGSAAATARSVALASNT